MNRISKSIAFILVFMLVLTLAPAISVQATSDDIPVVRILANSNGAGLNDLNDSRTQQAMIDAIGVKPYYEQVEGEKFTLMVSSGDVPDMISLGGGTGVYHTGLIESGNVIAVDDILKEYAPNMFELMPTSLELSKKYWSLGKDQIFFIPLGVGPGWQEYYWYIRWDYYNELGCPAITDVDSFIDTLMEMAKAHPTTADGKPTYAMATFGDWGAGYTFMHPLSFTLGNDQIGGFTYVNLGDNDTVLSLLGDNDTSSYWRTCEMYNKAYRAGLFDPDSFSQTYGDFKLKLDAGQYMFSIASWALASFNANYADQGAGLVPVPWTGGEYYGHGNQYSYAGFTFAITKNCQDIPSAMKFVNYVCSYEGLETLYNGVEGVDWNNVDGKIVLTDSFLAEKKAGTLRANKTGIGYDTNYMGFTSLTIDPALNMPLQWVNDPVLAGLANTPVEEEFSKHYGAASPLEVWSNAVKNGDMKDFSTLDTLAKSLMPVIPDDLAKMNTNLDTLIATYGARLCLAESEEEFAAIKAEALQEFEDAGRDTLLDWYSEQWKIARENAATLK